jgi:hypothetical protein
LSQLEFFEEASIASCLFDRVEVRALKVLDQGENEHRLVIEVADDSRDFVPAEVGCSPEATFACDELECVSAAADGDGLKEPARFEGSLQLSELLRIEFATRLEGVWPNSADRDPLKVV